jgi:hypothetical protein
VAQGQRRGGLAGEVLQQHLAGEGVVLVVGREHRPQQLAGGIEQGRGAVPLDALAQRVRAGARGHGRAPGGRAHDGMRVERGARALGHRALEGQQVEAVARGEQAEQLALRHDLAVGPEARGAGDRMTMPWRGERGEVVDAQVADEDLVGRVGAGGVESAEVRPQVVRGLVLQRAERLRAQAHQAGRVGQHQRGAAQHHRRGRHGRASSTRLCPAAVAAGSSGTMPPGSPARIQSMSRR